MDVPCSSAPGVEACAIVEGIEKDGGGGMRQMQDPAHRSDENQHNDDAECSGHSGVDAR